MQSINAPRILVVDDELSNCTFAARVLADAGYVVTTASDGPEALTKIQQEPGFAVFVIDVMMPEMLGDELARRIRQQDPDAKILYFTGYPDHLFRERRTLREHEAFVEKPVSLNGLLEAVSLLLFGNTSQGPSAT